MDKKCEQDAPEEVSRKPRIRVVKRSGGRSGNHLLLLKIPFSRLDSSPATGEDGENAEVEKRNGGDPKYLMLVHLYPCRAAVKILCLGARHIGQLWRVPQIKIASWEDSATRGWVWVHKHIVGVGGCRKED